MQFTAKLYPTPVGVAKQLIRDISPYKKVLDPSAGKGDLLDVLAKQYGNYDKHHYNDKIVKFPTLNAIEIQPELVAILRDKGYNVIDYDFLSYPGRQRFDYIIMNPPFDNGAKHLLHAWEISQGYGTEIRCLLNSETLNNPFSQDRQRLAKIIEKFGEVQELGQCFQTAERPTDVEISLVTLTAPKVDRFSFDYTTQKVDTPDFDNLENGIVSFDFFEASEARYKAALLTMENILRSMAELDNHLDGLTSQDVKHLITSSINGRSQDYQWMYEEFEKSLRQGAWLKLINHSKMRQFTTQKVAQGIEWLQEAQQTISFTADNMQSLFESLMLSKENIMMQCIVDTFDLLTKHHPKNRMAVKGWKTNAAYKVGKKFILPCIVEYTEYGGISSCHHHRKDVDDIDKAMCFVAGKRYDLIASINETINQHRGHDYIGEWIQTEFFDVRFYKAGTMHFSFRDQTLWQQFNLLAAKGKQWLPEDAKMGAYK